MKLLRWISHNILFIITLFLLVFIPLYPKIPLLDVVNTWVYVRVEDFLVLFALLVWGTLLVRKKITLQTPLTMPILLFWLVGAVSTIHGVILIFPEIGNAFPNVALLSLLRRIEYLSLFFVGFAAMKDKRVLPYIVFVLAATLLLVFAYGMGQKYLGFPAYLTMNEEFAKGLPIQLSALSRVPSTFAGHYDLAAYLVLMIPLLASMIFGFRNWLVKFLLLGTVAAGFLLLFMTVSRVSFFVVFLSLAGVLYLHKKRWVIYSLPVVAVALVVLFAFFSPRLIERFGSTVKEVDVLVDARTGEALGNIKVIEPASYFEGKIIKQTIFQVGDHVNVKVTTKDEDVMLASPSGRKYFYQLMDLSLLDAPLATISGITPYSILPLKGVLLVPPNASTGESLPQGTGYINLSLSPVRMQFSEFFYENKLDDESSTPSAVKMLTGYFLVKRASAYDLSFTTRYQGEWPNAIEAFKRNIFFGSGYSSISLAIDNSYLRMLGEVGSFGFISFLIIFIVAGIYMKKALHAVDSPVVKSFVIGFAAGVFGLILNATLIDVFEASKVAFYLWLLMGITLGILHLYQNKQFALYQELKNIATSTYAVVFYLIITTLILLFPLINNYFVGDDFTWLRWAAEAKGLESIIPYFTQADGFFYRPGTKSFFLLMYSAFWLNPVMYHAASLILHIIVVILVFLLSKKVLKDFRLSVLAAFLFVTLSGYSEAVFWLSSIGHVFSVMFVLLSMLLFGLWQEKKQVFYFIGSLLAIGASLLFHELGVIAPLMIGLYTFATKESWLSDLKQQKVYYGLLCVLIGLYLSVRYVAQSHWTGGDYSYDVLMLPFNIAGNFMGYVMLSLIGPLSLGPYETLRSFSREHLFISSIAMVLLVAGLVFVYRKLKKTAKKERKIWIAGLGFMFIALLPFVGFGNITSRYSYLVSFGFVILFALCIKKIYQYLLHSGRDIAVSVVTLILSLFFLFHTIQIQQIHGDWHEAGIKVNRFFVSIQELYQNYWSTEPMSLHFVDVPIRSGAAWVFPVGMNDALWFNFKNSEIRIYQDSSIDEARKMIVDPVLQKVFIFDSFGRVSEPKKPVPTISQ